MDMISHQHVSMNRALMLDTGQLKLIKIEIIIGVGTKDFSAIITAKYDMLWLIGDQKSG
jgi:hypothetical protein